MSYILDALKKSEREKTLGQVPTLESVVSDGAKKQSAGTPWWLNVIVFFVALLAVVAILKMTGLLEFSRSSDTASVQSAQPEESAGSSTSTESEVQAVADASMSESASESQTNQNAASTQDMETQNIETQDTQSQDSLPLADTQTLDEELLSEDEAIQNQELADIAEAPAEIDTTEELEEKFAAQEAEEISALAQQLEAQQVQNQQQLDQAISNNANASESTNDNAATTGNTNGQSSQSNYEEVIHNDLRDTSVNVVSYSSDARQRFVMLDLTIYKEGDQLANNATVIEIIRTGAIVEYQSKRYLLKP